MKVIGTTEISFEIENILKNAENFLIMVSPYFKLNQRLKVRLSDAFKSVDQVYILHRENELKYNDSKWLKTFNNINIFSIKNLHSKIYINEETALISSMNLYEYSQINNHEIGVKIDCDYDIEEFKDTLNEVRVILESGTFELNKKFSEIIESTIDYSMGKLYSDLSYKYRFKHSKIDNQTLYEFLCNKSRELVDFKDYELYQDKTAILRSTQLGKEKYEFLEKELIKLAD